MARRTTETSNVAGGMVDTVKGPDAQGAKRRPKCERAGENIVTSRDFACFVSALVADIVSERIDPRVANAACNASGKLLKVVEMEFKYGTKQSESNRKDGNTLMLS